MAKTVVMQNSGDAFYIISQASALTRYVALGGVGVNETNEADAQCLVPTAVTLANLSVNVNTNSNNGTSTITSRDNAGNGTVTVSIGASATGQFQDLGEDVEG